jgi:hypothetical protein
VRAKKVGALKAPEILFVCESGATRAAGPVLRGWAGLVERRAAFISVPFMPDAFSLRRVFISTH